MIKQGLSLLFVLWLLGCTAREDLGMTAAEQPHVLNAKETVFLDTLQYRTFLYFWQQCNPENGLVKDRSTPDSPASIAAVGFALPAWAIGAERGWIPRTEAAGRTLTALRFFRHAEQSNDTLATGYRGFIYHFLDMDSGQRKWSCELSSIDTAWLMGGIIFCRQYYDRADAAETKIRQLAGELLERIDWDWMTLPESHRDAGTIAMGWFPERGYSKLGWKGYNEALWIYVLAAGLGYDKAQSAYQLWLDDYEWGGGYPGLSHVIFPPLFGHQYSQIYVDFRGMADSYMRQKGIDYFENSRRATLAQRRYAMDNPRQWEGYDSLTWGLTACDGPGPGYNYDDREFYSYSARGVSGPQIVYRDDGTIAPTAAGGSAVFAPGAVIPALMQMKERYGNQGLWGKYGFHDAFNPTIDWYDTDYLGIDQGPILLMTENLRTGLVWKYCMRDSVVRKGLQVLGFEKL